MTEPTHGEVLASGGPPLEGRRSWEASAESLVDVLDRAVEVGVSVVGDVVISVGDVDLLRLDLRLLLAGITDAMLGIDPGVRPGGPA